MDFDWTDDKRQKNIKKHGIDFISVVSIFDDSNAIEAYDEDHSDNEDRYQIIGMAKLGILFVAYTMRDNDNTIWLISARRADKKEIAMYHSMMRGL